MQGGQVVAWPQGFARARAGATVAVGAPRGRGEAASSKEGLQAALNRIIPSLTDHLDLDTYYAHLGALPRAEMARRDAQQSTPSPISVPSIMGLIVPDPNQPIYTGLEYTLGWVDPGPPPLEPLSDTLRLVTPSLTFPNYTTDVFPTSGSLELNGTEKGWCSVALTPTPAYFPFVFEHTGWHQMVVNATWERPSVTGQDPLSNCSTPILKIYYLYASAAFSVRPQPTNAGTITAPTSAFTLWSAVLAQTPGPLPFDIKPSGKQKVTIVVLCLVAAFVVVVAFASFIWLVRRKKRAEMEVVAISRMQPEDAAQFLPYAPATTYPAAPPGYGYRSPGMQQYAHTAAPMSPPFMAGYASPRYAQVVPGTHGHGGGYDTAINPALPMPSPRGWNGFRRRWF